MEDIALEPQTEAEPVRSDTAVLTVLLAIVAVLLFISGLAIGMAARPSADGTAARQELPACR